MAMSKIEWTDETWNPIRGCSLVSAGCQNCYAMKQAHRFSGAGRPYEGLTEIGPHGPRWNGKVKVIPEVLPMPFGWKKPRRVFVNSMSDLFHEDVPDYVLASVFGVMAAAKQHTFQILTKRPKRMLDWISRSAFLVNDPLSNVWLGVSVEDQQTADERIPILLQTPAAVRWISAEPLLGPVDIKTYLSLPKKFDEMMQPRQAWNILLDWVVAGGESGSGARPCDVTWTRKIVEQCKDAGVLCFVKQLGSVPQVSGLCSDETARSDLRIVQKLKDRKGGDPSEWPADLRVREWPR